MKILELIILLIIVMILSSCKSISPEERFENQDTYIPWWNQETK
jgi:hypothetical protein